MCVSPVKSLFLFSFRNTKALRREEFSSFTQSEKFCSNQQKHGNNFSMNHKINVL